MLPGPEFFGGLRVKAGQPFDTRLGALGPPPNPWLRRFRPALGRPLRRAIEALRNLFSPPVLVLTYHRVVRAPHDPLHLAVHPERFLAQMEWLRARYPVLRPDADLRTVHEPSVMITFDDGYADNVLEALPILEKLAIPAAFFLTANPVFLDEGYWWDELTELVLRSERFPASFAWEFRGRSRRAEGPDSPAHRSAFFWALHDDLKIARLDERRRLMKRLAESYGRDGRRAQDRVMNPDEALRLSRSPFAIVGLHGMTHVQMASLHPSERLFEIRESARRLRELTGREPTLLAYPFGERETLDLRSSEATCLEASLSRAFTSIEGVARASTRSFAIPRVFVPDLDAEEFARRVRQNLPAWSSRR